GRISNAAYRLRWLPRNRCDGSSGLIPDSHDKSVSRYDLSSSRPHTAVAVPQNQKSSPNKSPFNTR
ncbi:hypothetical protein HAX54_049924, partial [Datura stramonium]|nr:hypothetical protein [Datura stramonium]